MITDRIVKVISSKPLALGISEIRFHTDEPFEFMPGQFANFSVKNAFLRRPISISDCEPELKEFSIIVQNVGKGSEELANLSAGSEVRALMPLGRPFPMQTIHEVMQNGGKVWIVAGGIGLAPMMLCSKLFKDTSSVESFIGFRSEEHQFGVENFERCGKVTVSIGGLVTEPLTEALNKSKPDLLLACGPTPLLRALKSLCEEHKIRAYVSLEERMGCGVGACLVCNCKIKAKDANNPDGFEYKRVCKDGPVFDLAEVMF